MRLYKISPLILFSLGAVFNIHAEEPISYVDQHDWQGLYIGGHLTSTQSDMDWVFKQPNYFNTLGTNILGDHFEHDDVSLGGGAHIGFNYLIHQWLIGVEAAFTDVNLKESTPSPYFPTLDTFSSEIHWYSTIAARLGYQHQRWLGFISGGWALGQAELTLHSTTNVDAYSKFRTNGWHAGAGIEYLMWPSLSLGLAYQFVQLNKHDKAITCSSCGVGAGLGTPLMDTKHRIQTVSLRLSYLFNL